MQRGTICLLLLCAGCAGNLPREKTVKLLKALAHDYQELRAPAGDPVAPLLARYASVDQAKYVLDRIRAAGDRAYEVDAWLRVYAQGKDGLRHQHESWHVLRIEQQAGGALAVAANRIVRQVGCQGKGELFVERTAEVGLAARHVPHTEIDREIPIIPGNFSGAGASAGDIDGDGDLDLLVGDGARTRLYRNDGGRFTEITDTAFPAVYDKVRGAYLVDLDGDGRLDVFLTRVKLPQVYLRNQGGNRFEDVSHLVAAAPAGQAESAAFADLDGDGDLDIYLVYYGDFEKGGWAYPIYDSTDGEPPVALRNDGEKGFVRVENPVLCPRGWGLAVAIADYDDDGDPDIYIANDFGKNHLLRNDGGWRFTDVSEAAGVSDQGLGMSAAWGDYDGDGRLDLYIANMFSSSRWVFDDPDFPLPLAADFFRQRGMVQQAMRVVTRGNSLFRNIGGGRFEQVAAKLGVERADWAWGANFLDFDNDGDLDLYVPNGFITGAEPPDQ